MNEATEAFNPVSGGCLCGAVRYTLHKPAVFTNHCHCSMCRRTQGAVFGTWSKVSSEGLTFDKGEDELAVYRSSVPVRRRFCRTCGSQLFYQHDGDPGMIWFTPATLDGGAHPGHAQDKEKHICVESKVIWREITDGLPQHRGFELEV